MMLPFNGPNFNPMLSGSQPSTPVKPDSDAASAPSAEEAMRFLANAMARQQQSCQGPPMFPPGLLAGLGGAAAGGGGAPLPGFPLALFQQDMKPDLLAQAGAGGGGPMMPFMDPFGNFHPYMDGSRRKNATRETTAPLKQWLGDHRRNPYPTKAEKIMLAMVTKMTMTQVSTWFANARRRLKKENKMTWSPRNRPGEDDDDLADCDRPSSSKSDDSGPASESNNNENARKTESPLLPPALDTPKKGIWSIADTVGVKEDIKDKKETSPSSSTTSEPPALPPVLAWQAQQQFLTLMRMAGAMPQMPGLAASPTPNPMMNHFLLAHMMSMGRIPGVGANGLNLPSDSISSLSPSSSTHSDSDKPPTLVDATAATSSPPSSTSPVFKIKKEEEPESTS